MRSALSSVRLRLALGIGLIFAATLTLAAVVSLHSLESALVDDVREADRVTLRELGRRIADGTPPGELDTFAPRSAALVQVVDAEGTVLATSPGFDVLLAGEDPDLAHAPGSENYTLGSPLGLDDAALPEGWVLTSIIYESQAGDLLLAAASPLDRAEQTIATVRGAAWFAIPALAVAIAAATWFVADRALRPVPSLVGRVRAIDSHNLHERLPEPGPGDESRELVVTLNGMLARLEAASQRERDFIADASHELRSPVATIRAQLEVAERYPQRTNHHQLRRRLTAEAERLESLTADLLLLAHTADGAVPRDGDVDLDDLVLAEVRRIHDRRFRTKGVGAARVRGNRREIERVVANLLGNATRYARESITVSTATYDDHTLLVVEDDGPGIPAGQRERVFQRFGRGDADRSRDSGGAGLGLALVRSIVERHGGTATVGVASDGGGGARFEVCFPAIAGDAS